MLSEEHYAEHGEWKRDRAMFLVNTRPLTSTGRREVIDDGEGGAFELAECCACGSSIAFVFASAEAA